MHTLVRDLLQRIVLLKHAHYDADYLMRVARRELQKNAGLTDEASIRKAVAYGRWMVREEQGRVRFKMYREMQKRYGKSDPSNKGQSDQPQVFNEAAELRRMDRGE
jgi:hypothetical protein